MAIPASIRRGGKTHLRTSGPRSCCSPQSGVASKDSIKNINKLLCRSAILIVKCARFS